MQGGPLMGKEKGITSLQNPYVKEVVKLRDRRHRDRSGTFLIEGYRELLRAAEERVSFITLFYSPDHFLGTNEPDLIGSICSSGADIFEVSPGVFDKLSYRDRPDGLLAIAKQFRLSLSDLHLPKDHDPFLLIAEAIEKPGNLGSILRSSDAARVDALLLCDPCTDIFNPNVVRASVGALFTVPIVEATSSGAIEWLQKKQITIVAATPEAHEEFTKTSLLGPIAVAVGTEQLGLSDIWKKAADIRVKIPMYGKVDSLNVSTATTLLLYEILRQRKS
jgi:TrmH family RNA methyltransferase